MDIKPLLLKSLAESQEYLSKSLDELSNEELSWTPKTGSNSIIFIFWHLTRVEDIWINRIIRVSQELYESGGWQEFLGTPAKESGFKYDIEKL